jgi:hypothetical protein
MLNDHTIHNDHVELFAVSKGRRYSILVSPQDLPTLQDFGQKWSVFRSGTNMYAYANRNGHGVRMHRFLTNAPKGSVVDHCDGNGLNNRRENLFVTNMRENHRNYRLMSNSTSGYRGVSWSVEKQKWVATSSKSGRLVSLGRFNDPLEARLVVARHELEYGCRYVPQADLLGRGECARRPPAPIGRAMPVGYRLNEHIVKGSCVTLFADWSGTRYSILVSRSDLPRLRALNHKWTLKQSRSDLYAIARVEGTIIRMHRFLLAAREGQHVDHLNRNTLDNRSSNLRIVTPAENRRNEKLRKNSTSGLRGVCWSKQANKWRAYSVYDRKQIHHGLYETKEEARRATARWELSHGYKNVPQGDTTAKLPKPDRLRRKMNVDY